MLWAPGKPSSKCTGLFPGTPHFAAADLLDRNGCAGFLELLLELFGVGLRQAFLNLAGDAFNQVLSLFQAQTSCLTDHLDDADLLVAEAFQNNVELGLFGSCFR